MSNKITTFVLTKTQELWDTLTIGNLEHTEKTL